MSDGQYHVLPQNDPVRALNILREAAGLEPLPDDTGRAARRPTQGKPGAGRKEGISGCKKELVMRSPNAVNRDTISRLTNRACHDGRELPQIGNEASAPRYIHPRQPRKSAVGDSSGQEWGFWRTHHNSEEAHRTSALINECQYRALEFTQVN